MRRTEHGLLIPDPIELPRGVRGFMPPFSGVFQAPIMTTGGVVAVPWWLSGGIAAANCIAAYQPKGAADLAASYVNLANPGTYNAAPGTAPTFDTTTGWTFNGSTQYLIAPITPAAGWSFLIQFANADITNGNWHGSVSSGGGIKYFELCPGYANEVYYAMGGLLNKSPSLATGNLGWRGQTAIRNGIDDGSIPAGNGVCVLNPYIGNRNNDGSADRPLSGKVSAVVYYAVTITSDQAIAVSAAMADL